MVQGYRRESETIAGCGRLKLVCAALYDYNDGYWVTALIGICSSYEATQP